ncbi:MAG: DNA topoisomerase IV subunit A [Pseudomonadota bacterium]
MQSIDFSTALEDKYYEYAMSTIMSRSLPDVRDGLKPVHRRLLYAMLELKLNPTTGFKKCARIVGDVIGKFHPHGDTAVYDTLVRLAQSFSVRYPLVEGQGNFGSIDGDNAAAMRYTEARLTEFALSLMEDLNSNIVDFQLTYDGSEYEPVILPAAVPNLLANGSEGIAVGMATSIPPHNLSEICDCLLHLIKKPNATISKLVSLLKGPDFPTGGTIITDQADIVKIYETGKGSIKLRANWQKEELSHGLYQIIIDEIPYQVNKSRLIEKIADLLKNKKIPLVSNIRDESDENIRIVIEPKTRLVSDELLMESLFKLTDLETNISFNMNVISSQNIPKVMNLSEVLQEFLDHRHIILQRKSKFRLEKIDTRLEIVAGLLIAYLNIDEIIRIIRFEDNPKEIMQQKWQLSDNQVEAILAIRLRSLRKLDELSIKTENDELLKEKESLTALLNSEDLRWQHITQEIKDVQNKFSKKTSIGKRLTKFSTIDKNAQVISIDAFIEREAITVILSEKGWIRAIKGHDNDIDKIKFKELDKVKFIVKTYTTDKVILFASNGNFYTINSNNLPMGKGFGEPIQLMIDLPSESNILDIFSYNEQKQQNNLDKTDTQQQYLVLAKNGKGFIVNAENIIANTKNGKKILNVDDNDALLCKPVTGGHLAIIGSNRKLLILPSDEIPTMNRGKGVKLQNYKNDVQAIDVKFFNIDDGLTWQLGKRIRTENNLLAWLGKRGQAGRMAPNGFPRNGKFE